MNVLFLGTPWFAVNCLEAVVKSKHKVVGVVTAPDAFVRGKTVETAVKQFAIKNNIPVFQTEKISSDIVALDEIKKLSPDIVVTCAFGQLLKQNMLDLCKHGVINVHPSLLPKYRGSSPVQWAIINGETVSGATIMHTDIGMDTGDIILQQELPIGPNETAGEYNKRVFELASELLVKVLDNWGKNPRIKQDNLQKTYFPILKKEDGLLDFSKPANEIINKIRGLNPWPLCYFFHNGKRINVLSASISQKPGLHMGEVRLDIICPEGKKPMDSADYLRGLK